MLSLELSVDTSLGGNADDIAIDQLYRDFMRDIADQAEFLFWKHIPVGPTQRLTRAVHKGDVDKKPGGIYTVDIGIQQIPPKDEHESGNYPLFVHEGTGVFGPKNKVIEPLHGNVMVFEGKGGEKVFTRWVEGQEANPFSDRVEEELHPYIRLRKRELAAQIKFLVKTSN